MGLPGNGTAFYNEWKQKEFNILNTDYNNYAVVYGCDEFLFGLLYYEWSALLSRTKSVEREYV